VVEEVGQEYKQIKIGDLCEKVSNIGSIKSDKKYLYVDISSIDRTNKKITQTTEIESGSQPSRAKQIVKRDDVLVSTVRPNLNAVALVGNDYNNQIASTGYCVLRPSSDRLFAKYLFYWVTTDMFINDMVKKSSGANYPAVSDKIVRLSKIPLPPLPTQRKIAEVLDRADALRQRQRQIIAHYDQLAQSVFLDMFGDPVTNPKGWEVDLLGNHTIMVGSGSTPKGGESAYKDEGNLFIRSQNVRNNRVDLNGIFYIDDFMHNSMKRTWVKNYDMLLNITGASIGRAAVYQGENDVANVNQHVCIIRVDDGNLSSIFLHYHLIQKNFQKKILGVNAGGTREAFNFKQIKRFQLILPHLDLQNQFAEIIQRIETQKQRQQEELAKSEELFQSLLQRAFRGELFTEVAP
jgi:type I restriction enzyme S subunit